MSRVLVTGAAGLVGRAVVEALAGSFEVAAIVNRAGLPARDSACRVDELRMDLASDDADINGIATSCNAIVHLAAAVSPDGAYRTDRDRGAATRRIDRTVFRLAESRACPVVYASGCSVYLAAGDRPCRPGDPTIASEGPGYLAAKRDGERLFAGLPCATILRIASPVGPGMRRSLVLPRFVGAALGGDELDVWGTGSREQNFIDVEDVAQLVLRAVRRPVTGTFNVAQGCAVTMRELAQSVVLTLGKGSIRLGARTDPEEGRPARYDTADTAARFGWQPGVELAASIRRVAAALEAAGPAG